MFMQRRLKEAAAFVVSEGFFTRAESWYYLSKHRLLGTKGSLSGEAPDTPV